MAIVIDTSLIDTAVIVGWQMDVWTFASLMATYGGMVDGISLDGTMVASEWMVKRLIALCRVEHSTGLGSNVVRNENR